MKLDDKLIALTLICSNIVMLMGFFGFAYLVYYTFNPLAFTTKTIGWLLIWLFLAFIYYLVKAILHMKELDDE